MVSGHLAVKKIDGTLFCVYVIQMDADTING